MELQTINKLYLELAQIATTKTPEENRLLNRIDSLLKKVERLEDLLLRAAKEIPK